MVSITVPLEKDLKKRMERFKWINWSEIGREAARKKYILEKYMETKKISADDATFCEHIDWHPVDELPIRPEYVEKLRKIEKESSKEYDSIDALRDEIENA